MSAPFLCVLRSHSSWHYPNSPKNRKTALSPRYDWLQRGSVLKKDPLRIWFYPQ
ncbi:transcriptional regulator [uncultured Escherichia sp.]|uniref:transcriptional regulator n=1 Tax=uncultured Escherichia sp. TaxID=237777 RepID=UPI00184F16D9|nr:transcriptional regulator [uncultured Escherichia sp.]EBH7384233.1 transcriptional regulator [Salmonella enterica]EFH9420092.1 transcriptional regulator [Escherichia coli]HAV9064175.1 transcriptional regulator [Escherichia coli]HAW7447948.1 transcriptional regulator [Escherichia coli]